MKVGIVGPGAMGSLFAYFFNKAGIDTVLLGKDNQAIADIKKGLNIIIDDKKEKINIDIGDNPDILKGCKVIFIFVKTYDTEEAIAGIAHMIVKDAIVITLQNGIGNKEIITKYIAEEKIVYGSTSFGATRLNSNTTRLGGMGTNIIGGNSRDSVELAKDILKKANMDVMVVDDPDKAMWKKAIINAGINPLGAILEVPNGEIISNEYSKRIQEQIVREAVDVALSIGIAFDPVEMVEQTRSVCEKTSKNLCSMLQDRQAGRRTEIDSINGIIIEHGKRVSITTPYNDGVYCLIKTMESFNRNIRL